MLANNHRENKENHCSHLQASPEKSRALLGAHCLNQIAPNPNSKNNDFSLPPRKRRQLE